MSVRNQKPNPSATKYEPKAPTEGSKTQQRKQGKQSHTPHKK